MKRTIVVAALAFAAAVAQAEINLDINTPVTVIIKHSMQQRVSRLVRFFDAGIMGLDSKGDVALRDGSRLTLMQRQIAEKLIDAEANDRNALVAAVAHANGKQKADLPEVRAAMTRHWRESWKSGWYMQDDQGNWAKKP